MKLTWRIWLLIIAIAISVVAIIQAESYVKLLVFLLIIGSVFSLTYVKSKGGKIIIFLVFLAIAVFLIYNSIPSGVAVASVDKDSASFEQGIREGDLLLSINQQPIETIQQYAEISSNLVNPGEDTRIDITTNKGQYIIFTNESLKLTVRDAKKTSIQTGLDISGGARALVKPEGEITDEELDDLISVSRNRFNVFGISDVNIRGVTDLSGDRFMLIEVAGATPDDLEDLVSQQGKFEAKIGDEVVFIGGEKDITNVCRNDATCASVTGCYPQEGGYFCTFSFAITLSAEAAERHADVIKNIPLRADSQYLQENLSLILDDEVVDELLISSGLKGQVTSQISIQGSGSGATQEQAANDARAQMHHLQTILITGSLPFKLEIVKLDSISPLLGKQFITLLLLAGLAAIVIVGIIVFVRYRKFKISMALLLTAFSELVIILGIAALIRWNLDLPSIAGILATIGTGVDQQLVILDESRKNESMNARQRMKRALFVVVTAYLTSLMALLPLYWAGAGLFKGFAFTSIIGITAGVLITRPAFADIIRKMGE